MLSSADSSNSVRSTVHSPSTPFIGGHERNLILPMVLPGGRRGFCGGGGLLVFFDVAVLVIVAGMDAAGARVGVGTVVAVVVIVADVSGWSEFESVHVLIRGLDGSVGILKLITIDEVRRDSESD